MLYLLFNPFLSPLVYTYNGFQGKKFPMPSTKESILAYLKRSGNATIDTLAREFGLAKMTVRQHLASLERDHLVESREERGKTGRPHLVYQLTDGGEERFPRRYERLAELALGEVAMLEADEIAGLSANDKKRLLLVKMAERVYREHEDRVREKALPERVRIVTDILREEGGFAEWSAEDGGFEIADHNCVYRRVVESHPDLCDWHVSLLGRLLGRDVECAQYMSRGADSCRFMVKDGEAKTETSITERNPT
jgi:predicted ArsR family transcriptional regulator